MQVSVKLNIRDTSTKNHFNIIHSSNLKLSEENGAGIHFEWICWSQKQRICAQLKVAVQSPTALHLIYVSSPLLPSFSFFGRDSLNEVFVLHPELQTPSKWSSIKLLPSSAACRDLRCTNFHWISGLLRLNGLVFKARASSEGRRRLEGLRARRQMEGRTRTERQRLDELTGILLWLFMGAKQKKKVSLANLDSCTVSTNQKEISHAVSLVMEGKEI